MTPELTSICDQFGVTVVHPAQHRPFTPMHTAAGATLDKILRHKGEDHLRNLLTALTESENNKNMLIAPVIKAVSGIMSGEKTKHWYESDASKFLEVMDKANLPSLYMRARANKGIVSANDTIATLLLDRLREHFEPEEMETLF